MKVSRGRYRCCGCGFSKAGYLDPTLDESGVLPETLERMVYLGKLLPYRQACTVLERFDVQVKKTVLSQLDAQYNLCQVQEGTRILAQCAQEPLACRHERGRVWMLETDGKFVPIRGDSGVEYREVKTAVLYKMHTPSERYYVSSLDDLQSFSTRVHGLLRHARVCQEDRLIGLSDGARWIANLFGDLGVHVHILDVFHASLYLEQVMVALGWEDSRRSLERSKLLRGELDVQSWLNQHISENQPFKEEGRKAVQYLKTQALLGHTAYPSFKARGFEVIGSGQIEGANKAVIGARLNVCGARWSESGAQGMVFARAELHSYRPVTDFHTVRFQAFHWAA